jgi:hypothetical protein
MAVRDNEPWEIASWPCSQTAAWALFLIYGQVKQGRLLTERAWMRPIPSTKGRTVPQQQDNLLIIIIAITIDSQQNLPQQHNEVLHRYSLPRRYRLG